MDKSSRASFTRFAIRRPQMAGIIAGTALTLAFGPVAGAAGQDRAIRIDLSSMRPGDPPSDFDFRRTGKGASGRWIVVEDATAASKRAIAQTDADRTDYRFPLAIYQPVSAKDVEVSVRFKPVSGKIDQAGGIAVRLKTPDDYYVVRANALEDNVRFYRVVHGRREQIKGANVKVSPNEWHSLSLRADGGRFEVSFDGTELYTARDDTFPDAGKVALWTKADSVTHFDRIIITPLR